ncbi:uncharacterized protein LOC114074255 [Solanum pennellii]|uniref:Uncharacterized protein LOC114074255 n=1 Tax=Solanum pennellii TaxID=28526 RepID=A0ABM1UWQ6_SOLPN|nr:uncharacterized protein LOC114074255 [Solanum pennellii]
MDLRKGYYQVRIAERDEPKTTWVTIYGAYEWLRHIGGARGALEESLPSPTGEPALCQAGEVCVRPARVALLRPVISKGELRMDEANIRAMQEWEARTKVIELRSFHGLANYYCRFISVYSSKAAPLTKVLQNNKSCVWSAERRRAFEGLKTKVTTSWS